MACDVFIMFTIKSAICLIFLHILTVKSEMLYTQYDHLDLLNVSNFESKVFNSDNIWIVEFYNSWCGHCIRFAPKWKALAKDIKEKILNKLGAYCVVGASMTLEEKILEAWSWQPVVRLGGVDCAIESNIPLCRAFNITALPTLKLFEPQSEIISRGIIYNGSKEEQDIKQGIIDFIEKKSQHSKPTTWPNILPLKSLEDVWKDVTKKTKHTVVIFEEPRSEIGKMVILDLAKQEELVIRRMLREHISKFGITEYPSMYLIDKGGTFNKIAGPSTRSGFVKALRALLGDADKTEEEEEANGAGQGQDSSPQKTVVPESSEYARYATVHQQDLESALHYSLRHEIGSINSISEECLKALRAYLQVLAKYFPGPSYIVSFLQKLSGWLNTTKLTSLGGATWLDKMMELQRKDSFLPDVKKWTGCQGSEPKYRQYPCGLWMLFHTLTVNSVLKHGQDRGFEAKEVLLAMRGYIKFFFGCVECRKNFLKGAVHIEKRVNSADSSIMFLWVSHNKANLHLHGDATEDPEHPKMQYPSRTICPRCYQSQKQDWNEEEVLTFLKKVYAHENIIQDTAPPLFEKSNDLRKKDLEKLKNRIAEKREERLKNRFLSRTTSYDMARIERLRNKEMENRYRIKTLAGDKAWGFTSVDVSLCILFYLVSMGILILIYYHFTVRRRCPLFPIIYRR